MKNRNWKIRDVILAGLIGVIFGAVYFAFGQSYSVFISIATPAAAFLTGHSLAGSLATSLVAAQMSTAIQIGLFMMAGPIAALIIKKPGAAFLSNLIASAVEMFIGSSWGVTVLILGIEQGIGMELGFASLRYKKPMAGLWLSVVTGSVVSFAYHYFERSYYRLDVNYVLILFAIWFVSIFIFAGVINLLIYGLLKRAKLAR